MPLFAYGTLLDDAWRRAILGAAYPVRAATLRGWQRVATAGGYLTIRRADHDARIEGALIDLDETGWNVADAWEEERYERVGVVVTDARGAVDAIVYVCAAAPDAMPCADGRLTTLARGEVEVAIAAFEPAMRAIRARSPDA